MPYAIYADIECLVKIIDCCKINPHIFSSAELGEHIPCGYLLSTILGFDHIKNKHSLCHGKDCKKEFKRICNKNNQFREEKNIVFDFERIKIL